jgi:very-short-patch-repair endonuclease
VLTRAGAIELGFTARAIEHRLATRRWNRVLPAVYLTGNTLTWDDKLAAALAFAGPDGLLTSGAALADLGLRSVSRPATILVLVPRANHVRPSGFVRLRRTHRMPTAAALPGPRRARLARAVADLALERRHLDDVRALVTQAVRMRLCSTAELWTEYAEGPHKFSANLRQALEDVDAGAWSAPEGRAARLLSSAGLAPFEQNARIDFPDGTWLYVDFLWRALRAVLEIDSDEHHGDPQQRDHTDQRHLKLQSLGLSVAHRRPAVLFREPRRFQREMATWLAARAREVGAA